jgi:hypothetical protein
MKLFKIEFHIYIKIKIKIQMYFYRFYIFIIAYSTISVQAWYTTVIESGTTIIKTLPKSTTTTGLFTTSIISTTTTTTTTTTATSPIPTICPFAVICFDDLNVTTSTSPIPNGYNGFNWDNIYALQATGNYKRGLITPPNIAISDGQDTITISIASSDCSFNSLTTVYVTSLFTTINVNVIFSAFNNGEEIDTFTVTIIPNQPALITFPNTFRSARSITITKTSSYVLAIDNLGIHAGCKK